jgi:hypothetical protein
MLKSARLENQMEVDTPSLLAILQKCFPQELSMRLVDFNKTKTHSLQDISTRSAFQIGPKELAHDVNFFSWRLDHQSVRFVQPQPFHTVNEYPLEGDFPCFRLDRSILRYDCHRPRWCYARESSFFHRVAQRSIPPGFLRVTFYFPLGLAMVQSRERKKEAWSPGFMKKTFPSFSLTKGFLKRLSFLLCFSLF